MFPSAPVGELVDTLDLGSSAVMRVGSSPIRRTKEAFEASFFVHNNEVESCLFRKYSLNLPSKQTSRQYWPYPS